MPPAPLYLLSILNRENGGGVSTALPWKGGKGAIAPPDTLYNKPLPQFSLLLYFNDNIEISRPRDTFTVRSRNRSELLLHDGPTQEQSISHVLCYISICTMGP